MKSEQCNSNIFFLHSSQIQSTRCAKCVHMYIFPISNKCIHSKLIFRFFFLAGLVGEHILKFDVFFLLYHIKMGEKKNLHSTSTLSFTHFTNDYSHFYIMRGTQNKCRLLLVAYKSKLLVNEKMYLTCKC